MFVNLFKKIKVEKIESKYLHLAAFWSHPDEKENNTPTPCVIVQDKQQLTDLRKQIKKEKTNYEYNHKSTKTPGESLSSTKGGSYEGTPTGGLVKRKDAEVITKYSPLVKEIKDELIALAERQKIGRRKLRFRL